jgi:hemerythrin-like domain-containing protein
MATRRVEAAMNFQTRRTFLINVATAGAVGLSGSCGRRVAEPAGRMRPEAEVGPVEDLMREHGVLDRILLLYEEIIGRIERRETFPGDVLANAAGVIRSFIENYHEKLEEDHLFPRFERAGRLVDLVGVLRVQHRRGRGLTDDVLALAGRPVGAGAQRRLRDTLRRFIRMYRPHEAREDTELFPALRQLVEPDEYESLGETFERREHELFGARGFEGIVGDVAELERTLGIHDLGRFTPA